MVTHDPQEELERVKAWWKTYGNSVITGVVIGVLLLAGINYWRSYKAQQASAASALYEQVVRNAEQKNTEQARAAGKNLKQDYGATPYAGKAALFLAKIDFDAGDLAAARNELQWAIDNAKEEAVRHTARLRLGRIALSQNEADTVLKLVDIKDTNGFESEYQELRGDALVLQGKVDEARRAYQAARAALPQNSPYARVLDMKLDDLGPEKNG